jgi:hypothetical protein
MSGGQLQISLDQGTGAALIGGDLSVTGGTIISGANVSPAGAHLFGTLKVDGNVNWTGGTYSPYVSNVANGPSDLWWSTKTFTIGGTAALSPIAVDATNKVVAPTSGFTWQLLQGDKGITAANNTPTYDANTWIIVPGPGNPVLIWTLKAK